MSLQHLALFLSLDITSATTNPTWSKQCRHQWLFHMPLGLMLLIMACSFFFFFSLAFSPPTPPLSCSLVLAECSKHQKQDAVGGKALSLLFARWNLCCLCTYITFCSVSLSFCVLIFLYSSHFFLSLFFPLSRTIILHCATLFNLLALLSVLHCQCPCCPPTSVFCCFHIPAQSNPLCLVVFSPSLMVLSKSENVISPTVCIIFA